jgi:hypothetical protein
MTLGLKEGEQAKTDVRVGFRTGWIRHIGVAIGGATGAAVVLGGYQVLRTNPSQSFSLLQAWGPTCFIAIFAIFIVGKFFEGLNSTVRESFSVVAGSVRLSAEAAGRTADALTRLADQGGKQHQEIQRLAIYAAQEFPSLYKRFDSQDEMLENQNRTIGDLAKAVMSLTVRGKDGN